MGHAACGGPGTKCTVRQVALQLGWSVRRVHAVAEDCDAICINTGMRVGQSGVYRFKQVGNYLLEVL